MKKISFSSPGTIILSGEYGINFGKPVLIAAIDKRVRVTFTESKKKIINEEWINDAAQITRDYLIKRVISCNDESFTCSVESDFPQLETFGYQGAFYTAAIAGLLSWYSGQSFSQETVSSLAYQLEKKLHKKSYGTRTTASAFGGLLYFRKEFEFLRTLSVLNIKIPKKIEKKLFIVQIPTPIMTAEEMEKVIGKRYNKDTQDTEQLLQESEKITKRMVVSLIKEDKNLFKSCLQENQDLTEQLFTRPIQFMRFFDDIQTIDAMMFFPFKQHTRGVGIEKI